MSSCRSEILRFILGCLFFLHSAVSVADSHSVSGPFYAFYHFAAPDPSAVIDAMDKFWASDCGKQYPADAALSQEVFNGSYPSTHFIINTFQSAADQQKASEILRSCPDSLIFLQEMNAAGVIPTSQYLGFAAIDENDWNKDTTFTKYDIVVEPQNQEAYAAAYLKLMAAMSKDIDFRSYGVGTIAYGRDQFTHWAWVGARSITELDSLQNKAISHPAYAEFARAVGATRKIVNQTQVQILKGYPRNNF